MPELKKTPLPKRYSNPVSEYFDYEALKEHLKKTGWSYNRLAKAMGIGQSAVSQWFIKRRISGASILKLVDLTGLDPTILTRSQPAVAPPGAKMETIRVHVAEEPKENTGKKQESAKIIELDSLPTRNVPLMGAVAAGTCADPTDAVCFYDVPPENRETIPMPEIFFSRYLRHPKRDVIALVVTGNSMFPYFQEGDFVLVERMHSLRELRAGDNVVFSLGNGDGYTLKQWDGDHTLKSINPSGPEFDLTDERYQEAQLWGRTFTMIRVRR